MSRGTKQLVLSMVAIGLLLPLSASGADLPIPGKWEVLPGSTSAGSVRLGYSEPESERLKEIQDYWALDRASFALSVPAGLSLKPEARFLRESSLSRQRDGAVTLDRRFEELPTAYTLKLKEDAFFGRNRLLYYSLNGPAVRPGNDSAWIDKLEVSLHAEGPSDFNSGQRVTLEPFLKAGDLLATANAGSRVKPLYLVITASDFSAAAGLFAERRRQQGFEARVVTSEAIFDIYARGRCVPRAVKKFLRRTYRERLSLGEGAETAIYVLLLGDAPPRGRKRCSIADAQIPTLHFKSASGEWYPSDTSFGMVAGDDAIPEMMIGRLPVRSQREARLAFKKVLKYEKSLAEQGTAIVISDDEKKHFLEEASASARTFEDLGLETERIFLEDYSIPQKYNMSERRGLVDEQVTPRLLTALKQGPRFMTFFGHGWTWVWAHEQLLDVRFKADRRALPRSPLQPVVFSYSCRTAEFNHPDHPGLGEVLVRTPGRGAVAFLGTTTTLETSYSRIQSSLVSDVLQRGAGTLGMLVRELKLKLPIHIRMDYETLNRSMQILGDPALPLSASREREGGSR